MLPNTKQLASEEQHAPIEGTPAKMTTYHLPPPTGLQFGSDPFRGFQDLNRESANRDKIPCDSQREGYAEQARRPHHEQLPSVRQLLTPGSQSSISASSHSSQQSPQSPDSYSSGRRGMIHEKPSPVNHFNQQGSNYAPISEMQQYPDQNYPARTDYQTFTPVPQFHSHFSNPVPPNPPPYVAYHEPITQDQHGLPRQIAPLTSSTQYYQQPVSTYESTYAPPTGPTQIVRDAANNVKPLSRLVGEQIVPGEGPCWVYEDGSFCKKEIDGEPVNGQWGVTKAGKPRKRLAIACTTCREKKIKCDPAEPKCLQCEKFGRVCRFTTA